MELDELKSAWAQYDKKLTANLKFNEELLRKTNLDRSKREMTTPLNYELFSVFSGIIALLFIVISTFRFGENTILLISGILSALIFTLYLFFSIHRLMLMSEIDFYNSSIVELQKKLARVKQKYLLYKKLEMLSFPLFAIVISPIGAKSLRNFDILSHPYSFIIAFVLSLSLGYPLMLWVYKNWYEKKIKNTNTFLEELNKFEKEE